MKVNRLPVAQYLGLTVFSYFRVRHNDDLKVRGSTVAVNLKLWLLCGSSYQAGIFKTEKFIKILFVVWDIVHIIAKFLQSQSWHSFVFLSIWLIGLAAIWSQILHFSAFCLNVMPSIFSSFKLPKSGPLFSLHPWETSKSFTYKGLASKNFQHWQRCESSRLEIPLNSSIW